jgi:hypothetical protein
VTLCRHCRYSAMVAVIVTGIRSMALHCRQGVPGSPRRSDCPIYQREPGSDDDLVKLRWPVVGEAW